MFFGKFRRKRHIADESIGTTSSIQFRTFRHLVEKAHRRHSPALKDCETEYAVILAVDLPFVSSEAIENSTANRVTVKRLRGD